MNDVPSFYDIKGLAEDVRDKAVEAYLAENRRARNARGESAGHYAATAGSAKDHFKEQTEYIVPGFLECAVANPAQLEPLIADLKSVLRKMNAKVIDGNIGDVTRKLDNWEGHGARSFEALALKDFDLIRDNQQTILGVMFLGLEANKKLLETCRRDVRWIGERTKDALRAVIKGGGMSDEVAAKILMGIIGVGITAATGGTGAALLGSAATGTAGVVEEVLTAEPKGGKESAGKYKIGGDTTEDVLRSMCDALNKVWQDVNEGEKEIAKSMRDAKGQIEARRHEDYEPRRPALADLKGEDLLSADKGLGMVSG